MKEKDLVKVALSVVVVPFGSAFAVRLTGASEMNDEFYVERESDLPRAKSSARALRRVLVLAASDSLSASEMNAILDVTEDPEGFIVGSDFHWRNLDDLCNRPFRVAVREGIDAHALSVLYAAHPSRRAVEIPMQGRKVALEAICAAWRDDGPHTHFGVYLDQSRKIAVDTLEVA